eukprot:TRINITY_DN2338_c0_g1_i2.p1 TRINITY_DN2338_c0_g1~~TRINITY_DN2338_c0_g1_i2.p1  ORF type:complete len:323 (-),score=131.12 TRINITY_DN2338_c0_g1_i2:315-1283(-)
MGKVKGNEEEKKKPEVADDEPEDPPVVKKLKEIDDKYLEIEREMQKEMNELQKKYDEKQKPILEQRTKLLLDPADADDEDKKSGTPACKGFWLQAMNNLPQLGEAIEEWDEDVLLFLKDVTKSYVDDSDIDKGFKLQFHFAENEFFTNTVLEKEYHVEESCPYTGEINIKEIKATEIDWKEGKDVTVELVKKKVKGGGAKKAKQKGKESIEPRNSFFRIFFRNLTPESEIPEGFDPEEFGEDESDMDEEEIVEMIMDQDHDMGLEVKDNLIPYAVRYYTGEAAEDDSDFDEDEEEEDESDDEESSEDPKARGRKGGGAKKNK